MTSILDQPSQGSPRRVNDGDCTPVLVADPDLGTRPYGVLPGSFLAVVDLIDVTDCAECCWHASGADHKGGPDYAQCYNDGERIRLHRYLTDDPDAEVVDHRNGDTRDNRRGNLKPSTYAENRLNRPGSTLRERLTAEASELCAECPLPCLEEPDDQLAIYVVADANAVADPSVDPAEHLAELMDMSWPIIAATPNDHGKLAALDADAIVVVAPAWTPSHRDGVCTGVLERVSPWVDTLAKLDACAAVIRPGPLFTNLTRPHVTEALDALVLALLVGCDEDRELVFVDDCEDAIEEAPISKPDRHRKPLNDARSHT